MRASPIVLTMLFLCALATAQDNPVTPAPRVPMAWDRFYDNTETLAALKKIAAAHEGWMRLEEIGRSTEGRPLWLAVVCDPSGPPADERPAIYIDANVHGNEIQGTEVCLYTIWYLLENRDRLPRIGELLRRLTFYIVPSTNPDGRESWFHEPNTAHSPRTGLKPRDDDRDGRTDEDGPDDLDGDGTITRMRKRVDTGGTHRADPEDPRRLVRAKPGEDAPWIRLGSEGVDNDGDGRVNEDGPGGYDMNRNFPGDWRPGWLQYGAGPYPLCYPETRAVAEFLLSRPNVIAVQSYHNTGGMILRGPGGPKDADYPNEDVAVYDELGRTGERMLPHYRYMVLGKDLYPARGTFVCWASEALGAFTFTNELWSGSQYRGMPIEDDEEAHRRRRADRYKWDEEMEHGRHLRPWKAYDHPQYGEIEIGGFGKAIGRVPPVFMLQEMCHRNMAFTLYHADQAPLLRVSVDEVRALGDGLHRVRARVRNERLMPTRSAYARLHGIGLPDFFSLSVEGGRVLAGGVREGAPFLEKAVAQEHLPHRLRIEGGVRSRGTVKVEWIVSIPAGASPELSLEYRSEKGGRVVHRP